MDHLTGWIEWCGRYVTSYISASPLGSLMSVAIIWGTTNALMTRHSRRISDSAVAAPSSTWSYVVRVLSNVSLMSAYGVNQFASLLYYATLPYIALAIAVPFTNTMTFVVTFISAYLLGEHETLTWRKFAGCVCMIVGMSVCVLSQDKDAGHNRHNGDAKTR